MRRVQISAQALVFGTTLLFGNVTSAETFDASSVAANVSDVKFAGFASEFAQLAPDADQQLFYTHYITSNEPYHVVYLDRLSALGGVYLGVGTDQNFVSIPALEPQVLIFLDFDQWVIDVHKVYRHVFATRRSPDAFLAFFSPSNRRRAVSELRESLSTDLKIKDVVHVFSQSRKKIFDRLTSEKRRHLLLKKNTYLTNQKAYDVLSQLARDNRYFAIRGSLTKDGAIRRVGQFLKRRGLSIGALGLTNAEQYFKYDKVYRENLLGLPWQKNGLVIRTYRKMPQKKYEYFLQNWSDFKAWLERPEVSDVKVLLKKRRKGSHSLSFWLPGPIETDEIK